MNSTKAILLIIPLAAIAFSAFGHFFFGNGIWSKEYGKRVSIGQPWGLFGVSTEWLWDQKIHPYSCTLAEEGPEDFLLNSEAIRSGLKTCVFADLLGGTPYNRAAVSGRTCGDTQGDNRGYQVINSSLTCEGFTERCKEVSKVSLLVKLDDDEDE